MYLVSITLGLIIIISSLFLIRKEFNRAVRSQSMLLEQAAFYKKDDLFDILETLQTSIDSMNQAFYEISGDLEGKYSVHEKELQLLQAQVLDLIKKNNALTKLPNSNTETSYIKVGETNQQSADTTQNITDHLKRMTQSKEMYKKNDEIVQTATTNQASVQSRDESALIEKITTMRSQGLSLNQIAKELGIGMGEVQLLIQLKK